MDFPCHTGRSASISQTQIELNTGKNALIIPIRSGRSGLCYTVFVACCVTRDSL
jgi:hypothetical protein